MLNRISRKISYFLCNEGTIKVELIDVYIYGFELILSSFSAISLVLLIGFILHCFIESVLFLICLITLRLYTGGYHANTYVGCNIFLIGSFLSCIFVYAAIENFKIVWLIQFVLALTNLIIAFLFLPIENKNKPLTKKEKLRYKKVSLIRLFFYYIFAFALITNDINLGFFIIVVLEFLVGTIVLELIKRRLVKNEKLFIKNCIK